MSLYKIFSLAFNSTIYYTFTVCLVLCSCQNRYKRSALSPEGLPILQVDHNWIHNLQPNPQSANEDGNHSYPKLSALLVEDEINLQVSKLLNFLLIYLQHDFYLGRNYIK